MFLPPEGLEKVGEISTSQDNIFCAQLQRFQISNMNERGLHSWHAENCYKKFPFLCKRSTSSFGICKLVNVQAAPYAYFGQCLDVVFPPQGKHAWT